MNCRMFCIISFFCSSLLACSPTEQLPRSDPVIKLSFSFDPESTRASHRESILLGEGDSRLHGQREFYYCVASVAPEETLAFFDFVEGIKNKNNLVNSTEQEEWVSFLVRDRSGNEIIGYLDALSTADGARFGISRREYYLVNSIVLEAIGVNRCAVANDVIEENLSRAARLK